MIDIWLVLCQMVPFAEVILLTAMEYQREEIPDEINKSTIVVDLLLDEEQANAESDNQEETQRCCGKGLSFWMPQLKTIGWFLHFKKINKNVLDSTFREESVAVPCAGKLHRLFCDGYHVLQRCHLKVQYVHCSF